MKQVKINDTIKKIKAWQLTLLQSYIETVKKMEEEKLKEKDIIEIIYKSQDEKIDKIIKKVNKEISEELKTINTETVIGNSNNPKELKEIFNKIEDNYNIKITKYNKEMYKQGFIDGVNLMINCLKSKEK